MANIRSFPNNQDKFIGAEDVMRWLHGRTSGVFGADRNASVAPVLDSMAVTVSDGNGWISNDNAEGVVWWISNEKDNGSKLQLSVDMADAVFSRIDRVVVSWQTTNYVALPEVIILKGTPASSPVAPALTNNNILRQISLASILIPAGATAITSAMITDERLNSAVCGLVTCGIGVDTSVMQAQAEALLDDLQDALSSALSGAIPDGSVTTAKFSSDAKAPYAGAADTAGTAGNGVRTLTHVKSGVNHALTGLNGAAGLLSCQFKAAAGYNAALDTLTVDGVSYTIKLSSGEKAEDNLFVSGAVVPCIVDTAGKTVNFKAGGGGYKKGDTIAPENMEPVYGPISTDLFVGKAALHGLNFTSSSSTKKTAVTKNGVIWMSGWVNGNGYISKTSNGIRALKKVPVLSNANVNAATIAGDDTNDDYVYLLYANSGMKLTKYNFTTDTVVWTQDIVSGSANYAGLVYEDGKLYGGTITAVFRIDASGSNFTSQSFSYGYANDVCLDKDGNLYAAGDGYIVNLNKSTLSAIWSRQIETDSSAKYFRFINAWDYIYTGRSDAGKLYRCNLSGTVVNSKTISSGSEWACPIPNKAGTAAAILLTSNEDQYLKIVDANFAVVDGTSKWIKAKYGSIGGGLTIGNDGNIWLVKDDDVVSLTGPLQGYTVKEVIK